MAGRLSAIIVAVIVGATFVAGLIVGAQRDGGGPVDLVVHNGHVYTGDPVAPFAEAVGIRGNQIVKVGSNRDVKRLRRPQTMMLDAHGGAVLPSLNDARLSLVEGGLSLDELDLSGSSTIDDLQHDLRVWVQGRPDAPWVRGRGWSCSPTAGAGSPRQVLDEVEPERPVYVDCADGRIGWANSGALAAAGIAVRARGSRSTGVGRNGRGEANGTVSGPARALIEKAMPEPSRSARLRAIDQATARALALGVTSVHDAAPSVETLALYDDLLRLGGLRIRIFVTLPVTPGFSSADVEGLDALRSQFEDDPLLKLGAVRLKVDDTIDDGELERLVTLLDAHGWQIIAEAKSSVAVRRALDAYARAAEVNPAHATGRRHRIENIEAIDAADAERLSALGVVAGVQPTLARAESGTIEHPAVPVWMPLWQARARLVIASNWPAGPLDPLEGLFAAVRGAATAVAEVEHEDEVPQLTLESAITAQTAGVAYAAFDDQRKGLLASGMLADFVILSTDVFAAPPDRLSDAVVDVTVFDGQIVYRRDEAGSTEH